MRPDQLGDFRVLSDPRMHPDGSRAAFVVTRMNLDEDRYDRRIWLWDGSRARPITSGQGDTRPRWSPDGTLLAFSRKGAAEEDRAQVAILPLDGGEGMTVTDFELGVLELEWAPDGSRLAVVAAEWTGEWKDIEPEQRSRIAHRITRLPFRFDDKGWLDDKRTHVWTVDPAADSEPVRLTSGDYYDTEIAWHPDGDRLAFVSARHEDRGMDPGTQVWTVSGSGGGEVEAMTPVGTWSHPSFAPDGTLHAIGNDDRWSYPTVYPLQRLDSGAWQPVTGIDRDLAEFAIPQAPAGPQWLDDGSAFSTLEDAGAITIVRIDRDGSVVPIAEGRRAVTGVSPRPDGSAAVFVASTPTDPGELYWWEGGAERRLTALNEHFRQSTDLVEPERFTIEHDGVSIEGWVYLPQGDDPVPLLVNIHGGPASQYGYGFFDEFQVYAGAGYGVVATNPRGSSGYGKDHVRAVVGQWQRDDPPDLVDLLAVPDAAAAAFPRLDLDRLGVMGGSYGGFAVVRVTAEDHRYRSSIAERGLYSCLSFTGTSDVGVVFGGLYFGVEIEDRWDALWAVSPLRHADRITTPTLVLHSEHDWRCPIEQGEQLFTELKRNGVEAELVRFPAEEGHELSRGGKPKHRVERFEIILEWHDRHLR
ncbi:MAG: S9 family peptidase [Acidimicrobiia bacterium]|nr:MAG: S9 family peptidase [Acidimicrobiia bacterium]